MTKESNAEKQPNRAAEESTSRPKKTKKPGFFKLVLSGLAMLVGVQSEKNRKEDFNAGIWHLVFACLICALVFFFSIFAIVQIIMANID